MVYENGEQSFRYFGYVGLHCAGVGYAVLLGGNDGLVNYQRFNRAPT